MRKTLKSAQRHQLTLGDLVVAVSSSSRYQREAAAVITDLFARGRIAMSKHQKVRVIP